MDVRFGPGGTEGLGYVDGIRSIAEQGLSALEVEFTYGVRMKNEEARKVGERARNHGIWLSVHAPYYVNLASLEQEKVVASRKRILDSCERAHQMGATYVVFHAGFYQKRDKKTVYDLIVNEVGSLNDTIKDNRWNVMLAPETTGKPTQFGDIDELLQMRKETKCHICIDFAHLKARSGGTIDYDSVFSKIKRLPHIHAHFSGIEWTSKGERKHIDTEKPVIVPLMEQVIKNKTSVVFINESPHPIKDAVLMKEVYESLR